MPPAAAIRGPPHSSTASAIWTSSDASSRQEGARGGSHNTLDSRATTACSTRTISPAPRPNYWAALLWRQLMGIVVLQPDISIQQGLHVYAHCMRDGAGGVALLVINNDLSRATSLTLPIETQRYTLSAHSLQSREVMLNGTRLALGPDDALPELRPVPERARAVMFAPTTITFLAAPAVRNPACV